MKNREKQSVEMAVDKLENYGECRIYGVFTDMYKGMQLLFDMMMPYIGIFNGKNAYNIALKIPVCSCK